MSKTSFRLMWGRSDISRDVKSMWARRSSDTLVLCIRKKKKSDCPQSYVFSVCVYFITVLSGMMTGL